MPSSRRVPAGLYYTPPAKAALLRQGVSSVDASTPAALVRDTRAPAEEVRPHSQRVHSPTPQGRRPQRVGQLRGTVHQEQWLVVHADVAGVQEGVGQPLNMRAVVLFRVFLVHQDVAG